MGDIKKWPIFNLVSPEFLSTIQMAFVYGKNICNVLSVTYTDIVYQITNIQNQEGVLEIRTNKIEPLCGLHIKTLGYFEGPYMLILTHQGMVYSIRKEFFHKNELISEGVKINIMNKHFNNESITDIACGKLHYLLLTSSGKVYQSYKQNASSPITIKAIHDVNERIVFISCGSVSNVIVTDDGGVYSWDSHNYPSKVTGLDGVIIEKVACGYMHVLALSNKGVVYVWGENNCGQLGVSITGHIHIPKKVPFLEKVVDIASSCHDNICIAMGTSNCIFIWGQCLGMQISVPTLTSLTSIHDAFAYYASTKVMHQPLICYKNNDNSVLGSLEHAFNDPTTSDLIIQVHGNPIHVHKSILMIRCQYFRTRFQKDCVNNDQSVIEENMFSYNVFKAFLKYLYTDKIDLPAECTSELFTLADHYSINQLKKCYVEFICKHITVDNVISLYNTAIRYNVENLEASCFKVILRNMTEVVQTPSFAELDGSVTKRFIIEAAEAGVFRT